MKNRISKIILAATVAATMMASSLTAFAAGTASVAVSASSTTVKAGETVSFVVSVTNDGGQLKSIGGQVSAEGLVSNGAPTTNLGMVSEGSRFGAAGSTAVDTATVTYSYTVPADAEAGSTYTFSVELQNAGDAENNEIAIGNATASATVTVEAAQEPTPDDPTPDDPTPSDPTPSDPTPSNPTPSNPQPSTPGNQSTDKGLDDVPKTGDASSNMMVYAVVAIAAAGAIAVVSAKKLAR